jgi:hypothetical protein
MMNSREATLAIRRTNRPLELLESLRNSEEQHCKFDGARLAHCRGLVGGTLQNRSRVVTPKRLHIRYLEDPKGRPGSIAREWKTEPIRKTHPQTVRLTVFRRKIMKKTTRTIFKTTLATSLAVVATGSTAAMAVGPFTFVGSDTLTEVVRDSIAQCPATGTCTAGALVYNNTGSGAAETALLAAVPSQRIAPMSRNFKASVLTANPNWTPQQQNIIGLDATVVTEKNAAGGYTRCPNLAAALDPALPGHAQVNTLIGLVLGGKDGLGDTKSCSDPARLTAVDTLAGCFGGISFIDHFYRRDDRSGTADTMKEKFRIQRFCNGRGPGLVANLDNNMANDDVDPIRHGCVPADSTHAKTVCTLYPATTVCSDTPTAPGCTQGLVVSLSQADPGMPDITTSIARRVKNDFNNQTLGFAGREASRQDSNWPINLNGISPTNLAIRTAAYLTARRLFVNFSDIPVGTGRGGGRTQADIDQDTEETALYTWMTDPVLGGRFNVDPILTAHGFLPCTDNFSDPSGPSNLCSSALPPPAAETTPKQCIPPGVTGNAADICCSTGLVSPASPGTCPAYACVASGSVCIGTGIGNCCAGTCTDQGSGYSTCTP